MSFFDASKSEFCSTNSRKTRSLWYAPTERANIKHLYNVNFSRKARDAYGRPYDAGPGMSSGSMITTCDNTHDNGLMNYSALRRLGQTEDEAWSNLGLYAGDDGVTPYFPGLPEAIQSVCDDLGWVIKMEVAKPHEPINYLGRVFPSIVTHDDSYQMLKRTLGKIHLSGNVGISREQAAYNKAAGYLTTDANTPLISAWCLAVQRITGLTTVRRETNEEAWKRENLPWPQPNPEFLFESVAKELGMTAAELAERHNAILSADSLDKMPCVLNTPRVVVVDSIVGDVVV